MLFCPCQRLASLAQESAPEEVLFVRIDIGACDAEIGLVLEAQGAEQRIRDGRRDLLLHFEHVRELALVCLAPQVEPVRSLDELSRDLQSIARRPDAALQHGLDVE